VHIAIVVPAFNIAPYLCDTMASVLCQTHVDWSLVVVDDGSTDSTRAVAAGFPDKRIRLIRQPNAGVSAARNTGIRAALTTGGGIGTVMGGDRPAPSAVLFLDGDDWLAPDALALMAGTLDAAPEAVAAAGRYVRVDWTGVTRLSRRPPQGELLERLMTRNLFANGGHMLIRRQAVEAAGDFRTDLSYGEDWEYWVRLAALGSFASVPSRGPLLFVRERLSGAYLSRATDPNEYRPALDAIYGNAEIARRLGNARLAALRRLAGAEVAWTVGRELIRHGRRRIGLRSLGRSIRCAPGPKRLVLVGLAWLRLGPFRPHGTAR
jgi:glycosyltransferase involved in cell wall biosynthesis